MKHIECMTARKLLLLGVREGLRYLLAISGRTVAVLEDGDIGGGMTGYTTAHLTNALDDRYYELERYHGQEGAALAAMSHTAAIDQIERIVRAEDIDCEFRRPR